MPVNVWATGIDSFHKQLAERDARQQIQQEAERRAAADLALQQDRAEQRKISQGHLDVQRQSADTLEKQRLAQTAEIERGTKEKTERDSKVQKLITVITNRTLGQDVRDAAGLELDAMGVAPNALKAFMTQPKTTKPAVRVNRDGTVQNLGDFEQGTHFVNEPAPQRPRQPAAPRGRLDNPELPGGVTTWIDSIAQRGLPIDDARAELSRGWKGQAAVHQRAQLSDAAKYLDSLYPKDQTGQRENVFGATGDTVKEEFAAAEKITGQDVNKPITIVDPSSGEERTMSYAQAKDYLAAGAKVKR